MPKPDAICNDLPVSNRPDGRSRLRCRGSRSFVTVSHNLQQKQTFRRSDPCHCDTIVVLKTHPCVRATAGQSPSRPFHGDHQSEARATVLERSPSRLSGLPQDELLAVRHSPAVRDGGRRPGSGRTGSGPQHVPAKARPRAATLRKTVSEVQGHPARPPADLRVWTCAVAGAAEHEGTSGESCRCSDRMPTDNAPFGLQGLRALHADSSDGPGQPGCTARQ